MLTFDTVTGELACGAWILGQLDPDSTLGQIEEWLEDYYSAFSAPKRIDFI